MKIDLTTILNGRVSFLDFDEYFFVKDAESDIILPEDIDFTSPVRIVGRITENNGCMFLTSRVSVNYRTCCGRCLDDIDATLEFDFNRLVSAEPLSTEDEDDFDETLYVNESGLFLDGQLIEEISLELPTYHLCSDDCLGLCQRCGKKLTTKECDCKVEKEIDPRLKILQKLLDNYD